MKEQEVFDSINVYRQQHGAKPLTYHDLIANQAKMHTQAMANKQVGFSHDGWHNRYEKLKAQLKPLQVVSGSENVAYSKPDMNPLDAWKKSTGHNKNLLSDANLCGIAHVATGNPDFLDHYYTAIFIKTT